MCLLGENDRIGRLFRNPVFSNGTPFGAILAHEVIVFGIPGDQNPFGRIAVQGDLPDSLAIVYVFGFIIRFTVVALLLLDPAPSTMSCISIAGSAASPKSQIPMLSSRYAGWTTYPLASNRIRI